jgi:hypothetical protein
LYTDSTESLESVTYAIGATSKPKSLLGTLPRHTQLGPVSGRWGQINLLGERHWVHKRFHSDIATTDREAGFRY